MIRCAVVLAVALVPSESRHLRFSNKQPRLTAASDYPAVQRAGEIIDSHSNVMVEVCIVMINVIIIIKHHRQQQQQHQQHQHHHTHTLSLSVPLSFVGALARSFRASTDTCTSFLRL